MEDDKRNYKKSIIFGITKLDLGGAERVLVDMCNNLSIEYDITIFTIYSGGKLEKELNEKVKVINLYNSQNKFIPIYLLLCGKLVFNKYLKNKYDIEIAFLEGPITRLFRFKDKSKKVTWVHNDIKKVFGNNFKAKLKKSIDKNVYKRYHLIVFVSEDNKKSFNELYGNKFNETVIYNYIDKKRVLNSSKEEVDDVRFRAAKKRRNSDYSYSFKIN